MKYDTKKVHIKDIRAGDTILHDGALKTVCSSNIKKSFVGVTIFGDSYHAGHKHVIKVMH